FYKELNAFLVILIIIFAVVFIYRSYSLNPDDNNDDGLDDYDTTLTVRSIIPSRESGIINGHEHIQNFDQGGKWLAAMEQAGVSTTVMVGSPDATFYLKPSGPFNKYKESTEELFLLADKYPDKFIVFPTFYTYDNDKLDLLKSYIKRGALGLKLFTGHHAVFYKDVGPLTETSMYPVYEYCERENVPIIWHVHLGQEYLQVQFEEIMDSFPNLIINVPHFMLSSTNLWQTDGQGRLRDYLEDYPNLYTDLSFGYWAKDGLWRISNHTEEFRDFLIEFQDRFTFGTDMVCTREPRKTVEWIANVTQGYIDILEKKYFNLTVTPDIEGDFNGDDPGTHSGLELPQNVLDKIYYDNMVKFLNFRYHYEKLSDVINESKLTYEKNGSRASDSRDKPDSSSESFGVSNNIYIAIDKKIARCN
ncbi:MAG: amidohydrolase family protein, partial [Thermoplasmata archaeon]|nr:amidohydrolase family protein [Thermoplasmata archaeon]